MIDVGSCNNMPIGMFADSLGSRTINLKYQHEYSIYHYFFSLLTIAAERYAINYSMYQNLSYWKTVYIPGIPWQTVLFLIMRFPFGKFKLRRSSFLWCMYNRLHLLKSVTCHMLLKGYDKFYIYIYIYIYTDPVGTHKTQHINIT